jgi:hypothetical protein
MAVKSFITLVPEVKKWKKMFITKKITNSNKTKLTNSNGTKIVNFF